MTQNKASSSDIERVTNPTKPIDELIERLNLFTTCGCGDDDWPPLRRDVATALSTQRAEIASLKAQNRKLVEVLTEVRDYHEGRKPYDFHRLPDDERAMGAFDAWQPIYAQIKAALANTGSPSLGII